MSEESKAIARRLYEEFGHKGYQSAADELVVAAFVDHNPPSGIAPGHEGLKQVFAGYHSSFTDKTLTVNNQVAEGDEVVSQLTISGAHNGDNMGTPETGKAFLD